MEYSDIERIVELMQENGEVYFTDGQRLERIQLSPSCRIIVEGYSYEPKPDTYISFERVDYKGSCSFNRHPVKFKNLFFTKEEAIKEYRRQMEVSIAMMECE